MASLVEAFDLSFCLDVGRLLVYGRDVAAHLDRWVDRAWVFHIHGVQADGMEDHVSLQYLPAGLLETLSDSLLRLTDGGTRVVAIEVFGETHFEGSMRVLQEKPCGRARQRPAFIYF